ncbi:MULTISPECIES: hypothetical protein [Caballeronia]|nr:MULTISPECIES: hypothetical protein [Caballeronia]EKS71789.1 hypothetical protein BURK_008121 [Burkholderia sp. SJ98]MDR5769668.1 hypothetical protein [Caballeronia sp. LZ028]
MQWPEMRYKGCVLAPGLAEDDGMYSLELAILSPDGQRQTTGVLGDFPCPIEALRFAFQYGMAQIDHEPLPAPGWTVEEWHDRHPAGSTWMLRGSLSARGRRGA